MCLKLYRSLWLYKQFKTNLCVNDFILLSCSDGEWWWKLYFENTVWKIDVFRAYGYRWNCLPETELLWTSVFWNELFQLDHVYNFSPWVKQHNKRWLRKKITFFFFFNTLWNSFKLAQTWLERCGIRQDLQPNIQF